MTSRIYVACVRAYNEGTLHGEWIDIDACAVPGDIDEAIENMLEASPCQGRSEQWAVHDYEGFAGLRLRSKHPDIAALCELVEAIEIHGEGPLRGALENFHNDIAQAIQFLEKGDGGEVHFWSHA